MSDISCHQQPMAFGQTDKPSRTDFFTGIFKSIFLSIRLYFRRKGRRKHLVTLNRLSDQQLSDIGITRDDVYESAALGNGEDVTCHLAKIARQRRQMIYRSGDPSGDLTGQKG